MEYQAKDRKTSSATIGFEQQIWEAARIMPVTNWTSADLAMWLTYLQTQK